MKKIFVWLLAALFMTVSCDIYPTAEETQPSDPFADVPEVNTTIAQLKALYTKPGQPVVITDDLVIGGQVISSDESGNIFRFQISPLVQFPNIKLSVSVPSFLQPLL